MTDNTEAIRRALEEHEAKKKAEAAQIGCGTVIGAAVLGGFPIFGGIYGIVLLAQGKTNKGLLFISASIAWFFLAVILLSN